jgi:hypothetical protein
MPRSIGEMVENFAQDVDDDIASVVEGLSLTEYGEWLKDFKAEINSRIDSRIEAWREDTK